jgi:CubicO group peptidase (beta-lactamase class C family)
LLLILPLLFVVPVRAPATQSSSDTTPSGSEETPTKILADNLTDSEKQTLKRFADKLESYHRQLNIPGMSAAIIKDRQLLWAQGFGFADLENKIKATPETPYHLASLTKTFASQIIMKLLDDKIRDFILVGFCPIRRQ